MSALLPGLHAYALRDRMLVIVFVDIEAEVECNRLHGVDVGA